MSNNKFRIQPYRKAVQFGFLALILVIGVQFAVFVHQLEKGGAVSIGRPPGVEGFLPISSLVSLKYWLITGVFNRIHPSGLILLLIILATGLFLKRGFCSWVCPVGLLSEYLVRIHNLIFRTPLKLPRWLDYPLRSLKYLILGFFLWGIVLQMDAASLERFIYSPYNKVADIKMLKFFANVSATTAVVLVALVFLSVGIRYFWCRYLCPYGALLGALSWLSPFKIHRNSATCIDCRKCTKVCPAQADVHSSTVVLSDECHACLQCVDNCPVKDTLYLSVTGEKAKLPRWAYALIIVLLFAVITTLARLGGLWQNDISIEEYRHHISQMQTTPYSH